MAAGSGVCFEAGYDYSDTLPNSWQNDQKNTRCAYNKITHGSPFQSQLAEFREPLLEFKKEWRLEPAHSSK